jgi:hypothetical protein
MMKSADYGAHFAVSSTPLTSSVIFHIKFDVVTAVDYTDVANHIPQPYKTSKIVVL